MNKLRALKNKKGFTLIELIIVIVIIAILAAIAIPAMSGFKKDAERGAAEANARTGYTAVSAAAGKFTATKQDLGPKPASAENTFLGRAGELLGDSFPGLIGWTVNTDGTIATVMWQKGTGSTGTGTVCTFTAATGAFTHA